MSESPSKKEKRTSSSSSKDKKVDRRPSFKDDSGKLDKRTDAAAPESPSAAATGDAAAAAASPSTSSPSLPPLSSALPADVLAKVREWKVKQAAITQGKGKGKATSRTHNFKPPALTLEALAFLDSQGARNAMLLFSNNSALSFADGKFEDFDDFADDE